MNSGGGTRARARGKGCVQGGIFWEIALIDSQPRMAMARCKKGSTIIVVTRAMFEKKMNKADPFIRGLLNILVSHIRRADK